MIIKGVEITFKEETTWKGSIDFDKLNGEGILNSINDEENHPISQFFKKLNFDYLNFSGFLKTELRVVYLI